MPNYLGAAAISPDGTSGLGAVEAGQRQARHAARRPGAQLPEHGARDQLAHRPAAGSRGLRGAHRPRQRQRRERGGVRPRAASTCSSRSRPAARSRWSTRTAARRSSASTSAARRRASRCPPDGQRAVRQQLHGPHGRRVRPVARCSTRASPTCRCVATLDRGRHARSSRAQVLHGKQLFYDARDTRLARDALHELRVLPQRRRPRRPRLGPDGLRRRPAQHHQPARPRAVRRASCTGATTSTRCRTSKARSAASPAAPGLMTERRSSTPARAASRSAIRRPASAPTSMRSRPTSPRSTPSRRARIAMPTAR